MLAANVDDGSCIACVYGCTDILATNYNSSATCDDGSCIIISCGPVTGVYMSQMLFTIEQPLTGMI